MSRRRGWIALGATFLIATTVFLLGDALAEKDALFPPHENADAGTANINGNELTLGDVTLTAPEDAPAGTRTLIVTFSVIPDPESGMCLSPRLQEARPGGRTWVSTTSVPGWNSYADGSTDNTLCGSDEGPSRVTVGFLVSDDIRDPLRLEVTPDPFATEDVWFPLPAVTTD